MSSQHKGIVTQIIGPVLDIRIAEGELPELRNAITIQHGEQVITAEVAQHIGDNVVRCIAMNSTDGLVRGMEAIDTGAPISVPVGEECLGRIFNLLGEPIDHGAPVKAEERWAIHRPAPSFEDQQGATDPGNRHQGRRSYLPLRQGRQDRAVRRRRRRQNRPHHGAHQ